MCVNVYVFGEFLVVVEINCYVEVDPLRPKSTTSPVSSLSSLTSRVIVSRPTPTTVGDGRGGKTMMYRYSEGTTL